MLGVCGQWRVVGRAQTCEPRVVHRAGMRPRLVKRHVRPRLLRRLSAVQLPEVAGDGRGLVKGPDRGRTDTLGLLRRRCRRIVGGGGRRSALREPACRPVVGERRRVAPQRRVGRKNLPGPDIPARRRLIDFVGWAAVCARGAICGCGGAAARRSRDRRIRHNGSQGSRRRAVDEKIRLRSLRA